MAAKTRFKCQEHKCKKDGVECEYPDGKVTWFCDDHMKVNGFCWGCHKFWGGIEDFDFNPAQTGLCPDCQEYFDGETGALDENYFPGLGYDAELRGIIDEIEAQTERIEPALVEEDTVELETIILDEAEAARRRLLLHVPEYIEVYRRITFHEQGVKVDHLNGEDFDSEWAEVNIPLHEDGTVYCVVCYIVGRPANEPAVVAMMLLNSIAKELVHGVPGIIKLEG